MEELALRGIEESHGVQNRMWAQDTAMVFCFLFLKMCEARGCVLMEMIQWRNMGEVGRGGELLQ